MTKKTRTVFCIIGLLLIVVLGGWQVYTGDTLFRQLRYMEHAKAHATTVRQKLDTYPEFRHLRVTHYTAAGGSLLIDGFVSSELDVTRVEEIVRATQQPVTVIYHVVATNEFR